MIHRFPIDTPECIPEKFTNPFRYSPHELVRIAAAKVIDRISSDSGLHAAFSKGKMVGVLVVRDNEGHIGFLAGFSGNIGGRSTIPGFVPPIFDLTDPDGTFRKGEKELNELTARIRELEGNGATEHLYKEMRETEEKVLEKISEMKAFMAISKRERDEIRCETQDSSRLHELIKESQYQKAELRRIKEKGNAAVNEIRIRIQEQLDRISELKETRARKSDLLQKWIFSQYIVSDADGRRKSIEEIFADAGITPPGGTGECAAPKLLNHAYNHGLIPLAMGEFWYGDSPETAVRTHGHFYPSCTSKCGPLLSYMMNGLAIAPPFEDTVFETPETIYEDNDIIVVEKPSGMPSVPGLDGQESLLERLSDRYGECFSVHRLDMDTSGIMLFARNADAAADLRKQFEEHSIRKTYKARLSPSEKKQFTGITTNTGDKGTVSLPMSPDYDERPRQKIDWTHGKAALTGYEVISVNEDSTIDILFHPKTGRTHQLRVHSAHTAGLGHPILGDMLYGGCTAIYGKYRQRLHLHALSITFSHPTTHEEMTFSSDRLLY